MAGSRTASAQSPRGRPADDSYRLTDSVPYQIYRLTETLTDNMRRGLRQRKVTISEWRIVSTLRSEGEITVGRLVAYTAMKQPVVSRILGEMEADGLVSRSGRAADQRVVLVSLTAAGNRLFASLHPLDAAHRAKVTSGFNAREIEALRGFLGRIERNFGIEPLG